MDLAYWEHTPRGPLGRLVESMWLTLAPTALYERLCVLPDGRSVAMLNLGLPQGVQRPTGVQACRRAWLCGPQTGPLTVLAGEDHRLLGIWFRRGGAAPFWGCPMGALVDQVVELGDLWGVFADEVRERVLAALDGGGEGGPAAAFQVVEQALLARRREVLTSDSLVAAAIGRLGGRTEPQRMARLASDLGVTQRHLARLFHRYVGPSPKLTDRLLRFRRVLDRAVGGAESWTRLAHELGYYDQAHLNHDFRRFTGMTPREYRRRSDGAGAPHELILA